MGFAEMEKADKIKLLAAIGALVVALGVIGWYLTSGSGTSAPKVDPNAKPAPIIPGEGPGKPAGNRRGVPGSDQ